MREVPMRTRLRVEEPTKSETTSGEPVEVTQSVPVPLQVVKPAMATSQDVESVAYWREMAVRAGERLTYAENQLNDLRQAANEGRARFGKYKTRLDAANQRINELQAQLIEVSADRDRQREMVADQHELAHKVHAYRQSLIDGPLFELFAELATGLSAPKRAKGD